MRTHWFRMAGALTGAVIVGTLGLTSASASPSTTSAGGARAHRSVRPAVSLGLPFKSDTLYVPLTPCRIVDTRRGGGQLATNTTRITGTSGFTAQGGPSSGCGVPTGATGISATIGATNEHHNGYLTAYPSNSATRPGTSNIDYTTNVSLAIGGNITINPQSAVALKIYNFGGPTDVFLDVSGYYIPQMEGLINISSSGPPTILTGTNRIISVSNPSIGQYDVVFDEDVSHCTPTVNAVDYGSDVLASATALNANTISVRSWYVDTIDHTILPVNTDTYILVSC